MAAKLNDEYQIDFLCNKSNYMNINNKQLIYHYYLQTSRHSLTSFSRIIQTAPITPPSLRKKQKRFHERILSTERKTLEKRVLK